MNINPNIITYRSENVVLFWRMHHVPIDSMVVTKTPIHLYYSPGRNTGALVEALNNAALRNNVTLSTDTIFSNPKAGSHFIIMQNHNAQKEWRTEEFISIE